MNLRLSDRSLNALGFVAMTLALAMFVLVAVVGPPYWPPSPQDRYEQRPRHLAVAPPEPAEKAETPSRAERGEPIPQAAFLVSMQVGRGQAEISDRGTSPASSGSGSRKSPPSVEEPEHPGGAPGKPGKPSNPGKSQKPEKEAKPKKPKKVEPRSSGPGGPGKAKGRVLRHS